MTTVEPKLLYEAMVGDPRRLRDIRRLQYRCPKRCLLLDALQVADTVLLHQKRYRLSHEVNNVRSSSAGRAKNTSDGQNHWLARTYFIEQSALAHPEDGPYSAIALDCSHVGVLPEGGIVKLTGASFQADWRAGHARIVVRSDGTQYAVR